MQLRSAATGDTYHLRWVAPFKDMAYRKIRILSISHIVASCGSPFFWGERILCRKAELNAADDVAFTLSTNIGQSA